MGCWRCRGPRTVGGSGLTADVVDVPHVMKVNRTFTGLLTGAFRHTFCFPLQDDCFDLL